KGMKQATLKPFHLTTIRSNEKKFKIRSNEYKSIEEARDEIIRVNNNESIPNVEVTVYSPDVYDARLIDLPGLVAFQSKDNGDMSKKIKEISVKYLEDLNNIPIVVHPAPLDPATGRGIGLVTKHKREKDSFGVITKLDMLHKQNINFIKDM